MALPRLQLFEFNDSRWAPAFLKELIVEALSRSLRWGRMLEGIVGPFTALLDATRATEVLDLCAGAGGPAQILVEELKAAGRTPPRFLLSDLAPHLDEWARLKAAHPGAIDFVPEPVDATRIPPGLAAGRVQLLVNALHHLPPALAREVLVGACRDAPGVFVAEGLVRRPAAMLALASFGIPALYATPWLSPRRRGAKAAFTWLTPGALAASIWDGTVSAMRIYTEGELRELVAPVVGWQWDYGTFSYARFGRGCWFRGLKR